MYSALGGKCEISRVEGKTESFNNTGIENEKKSNKNTVKQLREKMKNNIVPRQIFPLYHPTTRRKVDFMDFFSEFSDDERV